MQQKAQLDSTKNPSRLVLPGVVILFWLFRFDFCLKALSEMNLAGFFWDRPGRMEGFFCICNAISFLFQGPLSEMHPGFSIPKQRNRSIQWIQRI